MKAVSIQYVLPLTEVVGSFGLGAECLFGTDVAFLTSSVRFAILLCQLQIEYS